MFRVNHPEHGSRPWLGRVDTLTGARWNPLLPPFPCHRWRWSSGCCQCWRHGTRRTQHARYSPCPVLQRAVSPCAAQAACRYCCRSCMAQRPGLGVAMGPLGCPEPRTHACVPMQHCTTLSSPSQTRAWRARKCVSCTCWSRSEPTVRPAGTGCRPRTALPREAGWAAVSVRLPGHLCAMTTEIGLSRWQGDFISSHQPFLCVMCGLKPMATLL